MPQSLQESLDSVIESQNVQHPPVSAPENSEHSQLSAMDHPENTETHILHTDSDPPAGSSADPAQGVVDPPGTIAGILIPIGPFGANPEQLPIPALPPHFVPINLAHVTQHWGMEQLQPANAAAGSTGPQFAVMIHGNPATAAGNVNSTASPPTVVESLVLQLIQDPAAQQALDNMVTSFVARHFSQLNDPAPSKEEAVHFVQNLTKIDLETLAENDRVRPVPSIHPPSPLFTNLALYSGLCDLSW